jgi:hypothetical protein
LPRKKGAVCSGIKGSVYSGIRGSVSPEFPLPSNISLNSGNPERGQQFIAENCRTGFGFCKKGFSGGAVLIPGSDNIIGMVVRGSPCDNNQDNYFDKQQHFITSDFLLEKIDIFLDEMGNR